MGLVTCWLCGVLYIQILYIHGNTMFHLAHQQHPYNLAKLVDVHISRKMMFTCVSRDRTQNPS